MMPSRAKKAVIWFRANSPWRRALPNRTVKRHVQGVDLLLPWSHLLPDFVRATPIYGQNLVELAAGLGKGLGPDTPLRVLDVGANVGDSALQIVARTPARVLAVEGDPYWVDYLRRNCGNDERITISDVFLAYPGSSWTGATPVRGGGTTHFVDDGAAATGVVTLPITDLRARYPEFDAMHLVKSDTDGLDVALVPAIIDAWADAKPVVFFEFDPRLTRNAGFDDPDQIWPALLERGYTRAAVWDNGGNALGQFDIADAARHAQVLAQDPDVRGYYFWDVAVRRDDQPTVADLFNRLVPMEFQ
jgi:FkbM family methyltransferase